MYLGNVYPGNETSVSWECVSWKLRLVYPGTKTGVRLVYPGTKTGVRLAYPGNETSRE